MNNIFNSSDNASENSINWLERVFLLLLLQGITAVIFLKKSLKFCFAASFGTIMFAIYTVLAIRASKKNSTMEELLGLSIAYIIGALYAITLNELTNNPPLTRGTNLIVSNPQQDVASSSDSDVESSPANALIEQRETGMTPIFDESRQIQSVPIESIASSNAELRIDGIDDEFRVSNPPRLIRSNQPTYH